MSVQIKTSSVLNFSDLKQINGITFWDIIDLPNYELQGNEINHTILASDRIDLLAYQYYQDETFKWVIMWANGLEISPMELRVGMTLIIPDPTYVKTKIGNGTTS